MRVRASGSIRERERVDRIDELIKELLPEILELILKEFRFMKVRERNILGWGAVNIRIQDAPFCSRAETITKVLFCKKCLSRGCW